MEESYNTAPMETEVEVVHDEADQFEEAEIKEPKTELTEEEAKIAAKNVGKLIDVLGKYKSLQERRKEKFETLKAEAESLPDGHYKKKQIAYKMLELSKLINPNVFWNSSEKGTYKKDEKTEIVDE